jgi:orotidine-5'-phosphate decarboxylase
MAHAHLVEAQRDTMSASENSLLSAKPIPPAERLILALDMPDADAAKRLVTSLGDAVQFYKLGFELFMHDGYFGLLDWLARQGKQAFVDLKFFDVPNTVGSAIRQLKHHNATFATVHGNDAIMRAACENKGNTKILAVTVLTSLDEGDLRDMGFQVDVEALVLSRARRAIEIGCDGVISSGLEVPKLRADLGEQFLIVVPGIRPVQNLDDQKRTVDVEEAFRRGADYIVVGRPIREAADPAKAARDIQARIRTLFAG